MKTYRLPTWKAKIGEPVWATGDGFLWNATEVGELEKRGMFERACLFEGGLLPERVGTYAGRAWPWFWRAKVREVPHG